MKMHNLLSLLHLIARRTKGKKLLINYSQSHVVISSKYLDPKEKCNGKGNCIGNQGRKVKGEGRQMSQMNNKIGSYSISNNFENLLKNVLKHNSL